jgi:secondary thiamine-phosphate synthase enzyme
MSTLTEQTGTPMQCFHHDLHFWTEAGTQFIDLTAQVMALVEHAGVQYGIVNVQTRHTTTAIIINEHEPLLLADMQRTLERVAPRDDAYQHNNFAIRTHNMTPDEHPNGHAHCQSLVLSSSVTVNVVEGALQLGRWQRIFLLELDCARERRVSVMVMGQAVPSFISL